MNRAAVLLVAVLASTASATPTQDLDRGRQSFQRRDWQVAIPVLNALLYPPPPRLSRQSDVIEAYLLLGGAFFETGDRARARIEFENALKLDPDTSVSRLTYAEDAIKLFEDVKAELATRRAREAELKRIAEARDAIEAYKKSLVVYEARPYYTNFFPFGLAQATQKRYLAAGLIGIPMAASLVTSGAIYIYLVRTYGFQSSSVPYSEGLRVRRLQQIEIGAGVAFFGLYAYSIFDAIRHHKPRLRVEGDDSFLPPELKEQAPSEPAPEAPRRLKKVPKTSLLQRLQFAPMVGDEVVGIGFGWEND